MPTSIPEVFLKAFSVCLFENFLSGNSQSWLSLEALFFYNALTPRFNVELQIESIYMEIEIIPGLFNGPWKHSCID